MSSGGGAGAAADGGFGLLTEMLGFKPALRSSGKAVASLKKNIKHSANDCKKAI